MLPKVCGESGRSRRVRRPASVTRRITSCAVNCPEARSPNACLTSGARTGSCTRLPFRPLRRVELAERRLEGPPSERQRGLHAGQRAFRAHIGVELGERRMPAQRQHRGRYCSPTRSGQLRETCRKGLPRAGGWDPHHPTILKTRDLADLRFLTIRQTRTKARVAARIAHAERCLGSPQATITLARPWCAASESLRSRQIGMCRTPSALFAIRAVDLIGGDDDCVALQSNGEAVEVPRRTTGCVGPVRRVP